MIPSQNMKFVPVTPPAAIVNNASLTCNVIDTIDVDYVDVYVFLGATDIALTTLKLQESDVKAGTTALTGGADVPGFTFGTSTNANGVATTLPSATDDNTAYVFRVDCRARRRFLLPVVTIGNGTSGAFASVFALLSRCAVTPSTPSTRGVNQELIG